MLAEWGGRMRALAGCPNVVLKLGGLGMAFGGFVFERVNLPPSSAALEAAWRPYLEIYVEASGADRCIFESNFPVDKGSTGYVALWNAFKRFAASATAAERAALFSGTVIRTYHLPPRGGTDRD